MTHKWHRTDFRVPYKDTDRMGVVHHGNYITWFENARTECMRYYDLTYREVEQSGFLLPVLDVNVTYKKSAFYDDCVAVFARVASYSPVRLKFAYEARKITEKDFMYTTESKTKAVEPFGQLLAEGTTMHMWVNQEWKPARIDKAAPEIYAVIQNTI
ncbi:4-hydroxybenzoyl-CoA thioesterase [Lentibacillus kapialis]|uniref:4-hydroxybenzoyl-CoA thioesterase n=1 Tax=Lentibacillus kapialis TaxID=340214 RepID=A0A917Q262_9BACI|nr:thioesterase family protein [Lentibacillus kapialis]GGK06541.1 4-hydroxybenzoyl-CoA thioesterase [Lentibacillus kapialis]